MSTFDQIKPGARLKGLDPGGIAEIVQVSRFGADALNIVFRVNGRVGERLLYRGEETGIEFIEAGRSYAFDADGGLLRLSSEAYRIRPPTSLTRILPVTASQIKAIPHQITAVYGEMLPRQPLRFLLADDPGQARPSWPGCSSRNCGSGATSSAASSLGGETLSTRLAELWPADRPHLPVAESAEWFATYVYLPKLRDRVVLETAIRDALAKLDPKFAYAEGFDEASGSMPGSSGKRRRSARCRSRRSSCGPRSRWRSCARSRHTAARAGSDTAGRWR